MAEFFAAIEEFIQKIVDLIMGILERAEVIAPKDPEANA